LGGWCLVMVPQVGGAAGVWGPRRTWSAPPYPCLRPETASSSNEPTGLDKIDGANNVTAAVTPLMTRTPHLSRILVIVRLVPRLRVQQPQAAFPVGRRAFNPSLWGRRSGRHFRRGAVVCSRTSRGSRRGGPPVVDRGGLSRRTHVAVVLATRAKGVLSWPPSAARTGGGEPFPCRRSRILRSSSGARSLAGRRSRGLPISA